MNPSIRGNKMNTPIKRQDYKVNLNALTVIQLFLPANFTFTKLALAAKKVREALFTCGLRKNRNLLLRIPFEELSAISQKAVQSMVEFTEELTITDDLTDQKYEEVYLKNLDLLSEHIIQLHRQNEVYKIKLSIKLNSRVLSIIKALFYRGEQLFQKVIKPSKKNNILQNFMQLMAIIEGFRQIEFEYVMFAPINNQETREESKQSECQKVSKLHLSSLEQAKYQVQTLQFYECDFYGSIIDWHNLRKQYPNLKILQLKCVRILDNSEFSNFPKLEELTVQQIFIQQRVQNASGIQYVTKSCGATLKMLLCMIYGENLKELPIKPSNIKALNADVNFANEFENMQSNQLSVYLASIGAIRQCKLCDNRSVFKFEWIYKILHSVSQIENTNYYPPIELKISKFKDGWSETPYIPQIIHKELSRIAELNMLQISKIKRASKSKIEMHLELKDKKSRGITIEVEQDKIDSIFDINGVLYKTGFIV